MNRTVTAIAFVLSAIALVACGTPGGATGARPSPSPSTRARNGAAGELVKIAGRELILSSPAGDTIVRYTETTTFSRSSSGNLSDIVPGRCVLGVGQKDGSGALIASVVRVSTKVAGVCAAPGAGTGDPGRRPRATPSPGASPRPAAASIVGEVTAVSGSAVQVRDATGTTQTLTVPTTIAVTKASAAAPTDLALHQCLQAQGRPDGSGVVNARSINIVPSSGGGCALGGGFGRFGGSRGGGPAGAAGAVGAGGSPGD